MGNKVFPNDFLWGASTSAHQVEGGTHNQWSEWEHRNAQRLADTFPARLSWLPKYEAVKAAGTDPLNYISGNGVGHYQHYKEDFALLKQLRMNAYRFSIEWSRIEPEEGKWDVGEIEHYREYIAELKRLGIEPLPTLWHWTMPVWFTDQGGFEKRQNIRFFERFVAKMAKEFGGQLRYLTTLNEPNVYASMGYLSGEWPPQRRSPLLALRVFYNLIKAHRRSYAILKRACPELQVGVAMAMSGAKADKGDYIGTRVARIADYAWNHWFLSRIRAQQDFIGINYYFANYYRGTKIANPDEPKSDLGWYMEPGNIEQVLVGTWRRYHVPLIITENGLADATDTHRQWWLEETIAAMDRAVASGVRLKGYLHWSLLDNFEWAYGWWPKFGLIEVDRSTMQRTVRPSARWLAEHISQVTSK